MIKVSRCAGGIHKTAESSAQVQQSPNLAAESKSMEPLPIKEASDDNFLTRQTPRGVSALTKQRSPRARYDAARAQSVVRGYQGNNL
jgi:hypothetical protein